jgi:septal ring factor EnvC (AmiA/AmiB activator)
METAENKPNTKKYKIIISILSIVIVVLAWQLIVSKTKVNTYTVEKEKAVSQNNQLQHELDSLLKEHDRIKSEYGSLSAKLSEKDSIIVAKADEIQKLIASQADYGRIKRKLDYLRGITQGYVTQIDSLYRVNKTLKDENIKIKEDYTKETAKTTELTKDKEKLTEKVNLASLLKA